MGTFMQLVLYVKWILAHVYDYPRSFPLEALPRKRVYRTKCVEALTMWIGTPHMYYNLNVAMKS